MSEENHSAKFAFYYLLSLVALLFMAIGSGLILFQIINKNIIDLVSDTYYRGRYSGSALRFGLSSLIVATPIYYFLAIQIQKNLYKGTLKNDSGVRKWLSYFVLLVSSVVMIAWFVSIINSFLSGELTLKVILKFFSILLISGLIFGFYLYDLKRKEVLGVKDKLVKFYFIGTLLIVLIIFISGFVFVESPFQVRNRKFDQKLISKFSKINNNIRSYYLSNHRLPNTLEELRNYYPNLKENDFKNIKTGKKIEYKVLGKYNYELCSDFLTSNLNDSDSPNSFYLDGNWPHDKGYQCIKKNIEKHNLNELNINPKYSE